MVINLYIYSFIEKKQNGCQWRPSQPGRRRAKPVWGAAGQAGWGAAAAAAAATVVFYS